MSKSTTIFVTCLVVLVIGFGIWYLVRQGGGGTSTICPTGAASGTCTAAADTSGTAANNGTGAIEGVQTSSASVSSPPVVGTGQHCGGNMLNAPVCAPGYACEPSLTSTMPFGDVGGTCAAVSVGGKG